MDNVQPDVGDLLQEAEAEGYEDLNPEPVTDPDDPSYVEPYEAATAVEED